MKQVAVVATVAGVVLIGRSDDVLDEVYFSFGDVTTCVDQR